MPQTQTAEDARVVVPGDPVTVVDEHYREHVALVTAVHGNFADLPADAGGGRYVPLINVVYVTNDDAKRDPYGAQLERLSSLSHYSQGPHKMPTPGRYWINHTAAA